MKKMLSVFLAVALLAVSVYTGVVISIKPKANTPTNLITNGDFENDATGWELDGATIMNDGGAQSGSKYLKLNQAQYHASSQKITVEKNTDYTLTYYAKTTGGRLFIIVDENSFDEAAPIKSSNFKCAETWTPYVLEFNSADNTSISIFFRGNAWANDGTTLIDNVSVTKMETEDAIVKNGSFENGTAKWTMGGSTVETGAAQDGDKFLKVATSAYNRTTQTITVEENTDYQLSFWFNTSDNNYFEANVYAGSKWDANKLLPVSPAGDFANRHAVVPDNKLNQWVYCKIPFSSGNNTSLTVGFQPNWFDTDRAGTLYIDNVVVEKLVVDSEIVKNGSFENDGESWSLSGGSAIKSDGAYNGSKYLHTSSAAYARTTQSITVERNTNYTLKFYYKVSNKSQPFEANVYAGSKWDANKLLTGASEQDNRHPIYPQVVNEWKPHATTFNSGNNTSLTVGFQADWGSTGRTGTLYIDYVTIVKVPEGGASFQNGGFEDDTLGWTVAGGTVIEDKATAHTGNKCLSTGLGQHQRSTQKFAVTKNTDYVVKFYYNAAQDKVFEVNVYKEKWDSGKLLPSTVNGHPEWGYCIDPPHLNKWTLVVVEFNSGDNTELYLGFQANMDGANRTARLLIDDVSVEKKALGTSFIKNGSFENDLTDWIATSDKFTVSADAKDGTKSLKAEIDTYSRLTQDLYLDKSHGKYKVSFWYKQPKDDSLSIVSIGQYPDSFETEGVYYKTKLPKSEDWKKIEFVFDSGTTAAKPVYSVFFNIQTSMVGEYYIDNITVEKTNDAATAFTPGDPAGPFEAMAGGELYKNSGPFISKSRDVNLIEDYSFEGGTDSNAVWNTPAFINGNVSVVKDSEIAHTGEYGLKYTAGEDGGRSTFIVPVKPNTDYYFTAWVKYPGWSKSNTGGMTFGISNADSGTFIAWDGWTTTGTFYSENRQLAAFSPDNEWHLTTIKFDSNDATAVGITMTGPTSTIYFDDLHLVEVGNAERYIKHNSLNRQDWVDAKRTGNTTLVEPKEGVTNLIENADLDDKNDSFWNNASSYGKDVSIVDINSIDRQNALVYDNDDLYPDRTYYIKWIDVEKNTDYTFSADYLLEVAGDDTFFAVLGGERNHYRMPTRVYQVSLGEDNYNTNPTWKTFGLTFNSGDSDSIGFAVFNDGGKAYFDRFRLFETKDSQGNANGMKREDTSPTYKLKSNVYTIKNGVITVKATKNGITLNSIKNEFERSKYIRLFDADNNEIKGTAKAGTGAYIKLMNGPEVMDSARIFVLGDVNGDGLVNSADTKLIRQHIVGTVKLEGMFFTAADMDKDGKITIRDAVLLAKGQPV